MKVRCVREGSSTTGFPDEILPKVGEVYTVVDVKMGPKFEECPIWYELKELGINVHTYKLFETVTENTKKPVEITKVSAINILKLKGVKNDLGNI